MDDLLQRKRDHLRLVADGACGMEATSTGLAGLRLAFDPLPDLALDQIDTRATWLGRQLAWPFVIAAMSGGPAEAGALNRRLARAAARAGVGLELGSLRAALADPATLASFDVRAALPDQPLVGNLGLSALRDTPLARVRALVERLGLDGLALHLNPLHEALQVGGDTDFRGLEARLPEIMAALPLPVGVKTVGFGVGRAALARLAAIPGLAFLEIHGAGGTSFARVEAARLAATPGPAARALAVAAQDFLDEGVPLVWGLRAARALAGAPPLLAGGGLRGGLDVARVVALGARAGTAAAPVLAAALAGDEALDALLAGWAHAFRIACFVTGTPDVAALRARGEALFEAPA